MRSNLRDSFLTIFNGPFFVSNLYGYTLYTTNHCFFTQTFWKRKKKFWTNFLVRAAPKSWSKYTTSIREASSFSSQFYFGLQCYLAVNYNLKLLWEMTAVVYFNQCLGAAHSKCWSKSSFLTFFVLKKTLHHFWAVGCKTFVEDHKLASVP